MAEMLVNEFRTGKLGRISLERPSAEETKDETVEE
jgi:ribosome biogenesis GTPase A